MSVVKGQALRLHPAAAGRRARRWAGGVARALVGGARIRSLVFDVLVAVSVCGLDVWQLGDPDGGTAVDRLAGVAFLASVAVPLVWRRRRPVAVLAVVTVVNLVWFALPYVAQSPLEHLNAGFYAFIVSVYSAGLYTASRRTAVTAVVVALGVVLPAAALLDEDFMTQMREAHRSARLGQPEDIAGAVAYLLSDDGAWINGQVWSVNGGIFLRD